MGAAAASADALVVASRAGQHRRCSFPLHSTTLRNVVEVSYVVLREQKTVVTGRRWSSRRTQPQRLPLEPGPQRSDRSLRRFSGDPSACPYWLGRRESLWTPPHWPSSQLRRWRPREGGAGGAGEGGGGGGGRGHVHRSRPAHSPSAAAKHRRSGAVEVFFAAVKEKRRKRKRGGESGGEGRLLGVNVAPVLGVRCLGVA